MGEHGTPDEPGRSSGLVLDDGTLRITWRSGEPPIMVLAGEVDESSYPGLVAALTGAAAQYDEIHLDLAGLRAIVRLASPDVPGGGAVKQVVLHRVPDSVRTVLHIVGWDTAVQLTLAPG